MNTRLGEHYLSQFVPGTVNDVIKVLRKCPAKFCELNSLPTSLVRELAVTISPYIESVVNMSLQTIVVPLELKKTIVTPLPKDPELDLNVYKQYRPISNLYFY